MTIPGAVRVGSWRFTDLLPGDYRVSVNWTAGSAYTSQALYLVNNGPLQIAAVKKDQTQSPADLWAKNSTNDNVLWEDLGVYKIGNGELRVTLRDEDLTANHTAYVGEVRIERVSDDYIRADYEYDHKNRLIGVEYRNEDKQTAPVEKAIEYVYDVMGRRIAQKVDSDGAVNGLQFNGTAYVYDGPHRALEFDLGFETEENGGAVAYSDPTRRYLYGPAVDQVLAIEEIIDSAPNKTRWTLTDSQGSVRVLYGDATDQRAFDYTAFGEPLDVDMSVNLTTDEMKALDLPFFTGRPYDNETGFYYFRARDYDPGTHRFISPDPIGFASGDVNPYRFVGNSPQNGTDPSGTIVCGGFCVAAVAFGTYALWQAAFAVAETGVEYGATAALGTDEDMANFSLLNTFGKNFGINLLTGGIGGKAKAGATVTRIVGMYALRQSIEIAGDTTYDVFANDRDFGSALLTNTAGSLLGEAGGRLVGAGLRKAGRGIRDNFEIVDVGGSSVYASSFGFGRATEFRIRSRSSVASPANIRFSQATASPNFSTGGHTITSTVRRLSAGESPGSIPTIRVVNYKGRLFTLDNRRLAAFQAANVEQIPIQRVSLSNRAIRAEFLQKFNPIEGGTKIVITPKSGRAAAEEILRQFGKIK